MGKNQIDTCMAGNCSHHMLLYFPYIGKHKVTFNVMSLLLNIFTISLMI